MYLNSRLTRPVRLAIMLFLIVCFFIISPLVILYTIGYRYDFKEGLVRQTGVLNIDVEPKDAEVFLDDIKIEKGIPVRLPNLNPGTYNIKIRKDGYMEWQKDITVESKRTTYIRDIALFREAEPKEIFNQKNLLQAKLSSDGNYFLLLFEKENVFELNLYNNNNAQQTTVLRTEERPEVEWSPFQNYALAKLGKENKIYIFSAINPSELVSYQFKTKDDPQYQWPKQAFVPILFVKDGKNILKISTNNQNLESNLIEDFWFVDDNEKIWSFNKRNRILTIPQTVGSAKIYNLEKTITDVIDSFNNKFIAKNETEIMLLELKGDRIEILHALPVQNLRYNYATEEWIAWSPWEIWDIYRDGTVALLNRTSEQISDVLPLDEFGVLLIKQGERIVGFNPGFFLSHDLLQDGDNEILGVDIDNRKIYFQKQDNTIWELEY